MNLDFAYAIYLGVVMDWLKSRIYDAVPEMKKIVGPYSLNFDQIYDGLYDFLNLYAYEGERFITPQAVVLQGGGDCDNWTVLLGSIACALNLPVSMGFLYNADNQAYHVFPVIDGIVYDPFFPMQFSIPDDALMVPVCS